MKRVLYRIWQDSFVASLLSTIVTLFFSSYIIAFKQRISFGNAFVNLLNLKVEIWVYLIVIIFGVLIYFGIRNIKKFKYDTETLKMDRKIFNRLRNEFLKKGNLAHW